MKKHTQSKKSFSKKNIWLLLVIALAVIAYLFFFSGKKQDKQSIRQVIQSMKTKQEIIINENKLNAHFVTEPEDRARGLSIFDSLPEDEAMVFQFDKPGKYSFWMREMKFPIDILWLDEEKRVVSLKERAQPEDFPETYKPDDMALYVVEVNAGYVEKNNIAKGDIFSW